MADLLAVEGVVAGYGDSVVLEDVSFTVQEGGSLALLGRNGVGKTTLLLTLMGITRLRRGRVSWRGSDLTAVPTHLRAHAGLGWVPQERCVFPSLTVEEHLEVVARPGEWTLQRVYLGTNETYKDYPDISFRELLCIVPLLVLAVVLGIVPSVVLSWMEPHVTGLIDSFVMITR